MFETSFNDICGNFRFRSKYHPKDLETEKVTAAVNLKSRLNSFLYQMENGWLETTALEMQNQTVILKTMNAGLSDV